MNISLKKTIVSLFVFASVVFSTQVFGAGVPVMSTTNATNITSSSVTLNGYFNSNGSPMTSVSFEYGETPQLGSYTNTIIPSSDFGTYSISVSGLKSGTKYYFRAFGVNGSGFGFASSTLSVTTIGSGGGTSGNVVVSTNSATNITSTSAILNGYFNTTTSGSTQTYFEYGTSSGSLSDTTSLNTQSTMFGSFTSSLNNLSSNTTYYFRAVVITNGIRTRASSIIQFTTTPSSSNSACRINSLNTSSTNVYRGSTAVLSWSTSNCTNVNLSTIGSVSLSGSQTVVVNSPRNYILSANGNSGTVEASVFVSVIDYGNGGNTSMNAYTYSPTNITANSATLNGYANSNGYYVSAWIEFPCYSGTRHDIRSSSNTINFSYNYTGLNPNTEYCYRIGYQDTNGYQSYSNTMTFRTLSGSSGYWPNNTYTPPMISNPLIVTPTTPTTTKTIYTTTRTVASGTSKNEELPSAFVDNEGVVQNNFLGASAGSLPFLPDTFLGWLIVVTVILAVILIAREFIGPKQSVSSHH